MGPNSIKYLEIISFRSGSGRDGGLEEKESQSRRTERDWKALGISSTQRVTRNSHFIEDSTQILSNREISKRGEGR